MFLMISIYDRTKELEYKGNMSVPFAEKVLELWNESFGTQMAAGSYDTILGGFNTNIFGMIFGK